MIILTAEQAAALKDKWPYIDPRPLKDGRWALPDWIGGPAQLDLESNPREEISLDSDAWIEPKPDEHWHHLCNLPEPR